MQTQGSINNIHNLPCILAGLADPIKAENRSPTVLKLYKQETENFILPIGLPATVCPIWRCAHFTLTGNPTDSSCYLAK